MITSTSNEKVKRIGKLLTSAKYRREEKAFVVEGERIVREIPANRILECYVLEGHKLPEKLMEELKKSNSENVVIETVSENVMRKMSGTQNPQGVLCVVAMLEEDIGDFINCHASGPFRVLVLENLQDPGNIGTMIRTSEGAGFDGIIADRSTVDIYNPKVTRSTMGSLFRVPVMYTDSLADIVGKLQNVGVKAFAAHLRGENDYRKVSYGDRVAILIGNEGNGLTDEISEKCNTLVKIPMEGKLESLNASVAAALMMYEVTR